MIRRMGEIDTGLLYAALDAHRAAKDLTWRDVAGDTEISASTFSRMVHGQQPGLDAYVVMCRWLGMPMETFIRRRSQADSPGLFPELSVLLARHGLPDAQRQFVLAAVLALDTYRATRKAA